MQLKEYFSENLALLLSNKIKAYYPEFESKGFVKDAKKSLKDFELKGRVKLLSNLLQMYLPSDYTAAINILLKIYGPENTSETGMFTNYYWLMPVAKFIEDYGLNNFKVSMHAIYEITKRNTGEYAIRPYINAYPEKSIQVITQWACDDNFHVRRLASEGLRPRLPWAKKLQLFVDEPTPVFKILTKLKADKIRYVQKSVANHVNDYLKLNFEAVMVLLKEWNEDTCMSPDTRWIISHALRNRKQKRCILLS